MKKNLITIVIPTRNRPRYLKQCLDSVVNQTHRDIKIIVMDNNSSCNNKRVIDSFYDDRIRYIKNTKDIGIINNWNKAIKICQTPYLSIFHDDDIMLPQFIAKSIKVLERNKSVGFSYCHANKVDKNLNYISLWSDLVPKNGKMSGKKYIGYTLEKGCCITIAPTVVLRKNVLKKVGLFCDNICYNSFDFNMWLRIARHFDIYFINDALINYRIHKKQMSQTYWWSHNKAKGRLATMMELQEVASIILKSMHGKNKKLGTLIGKYNSLATKYMRLLVSDL